jgi:hypothetical protein
VIQRALFSSFFFSLSYFVLFIYLIFFQMQEEQNFLKENGPTSLPVPKQVVKKSKLPKRALESGVLVGLGLAVGYLCFSLLAKRK